MTPGMVTVLRDLVPIRPLTPGEARQIAERQATRLLELTGVTHPPLPEEAIAELPRIHVYRRPLEVSGASEWARGKWQIALNSLEPLTRQRFSLAHEFKHIIDDRFVKVLYGHIPEARRAQLVESLCDYFAGCLLMPRPWVKRAWATQTQDSARLAAMFGVSQTAMHVRLHQLGLTEPLPRHRPRYYRQPAPDLASCATHRCEEPVA